MSRSGLKVSKKTPACAYTFSRPSPTILVVFDIPGWLLHTFEQYIHIASELNVCPGGGLSDGWMGQQCHQRVSQTAPKPLHPHSPPEVPPSHIHCTYNTDVHHHSDGIGGDTPVLRATPI